MIAGFLFSALLIAQAGPIDVGPASLKPLALDFTGELADGSPGAVVVAVEFEYQPPTGPAVLVLVPHAPIVGTNTIALKDALKSLAAGLYTVRARWYDSAGQPSAFSAPMAEQIRNFPDPPAPPENVSIPGG